MYAPNSNIGGTIRAGFGLFKLDDAPLEGECALTSVNLSVAELIEVYAAKRRKDNARKAVEVPNSPEEGNVEPKNDEEPKRKVVKKKKMKLVDPSIITNIQSYLVMTDWQNKKANITYAQLFQAAPNIRKEAYSRSSDCVVLAGFLKKAGISIDHLSTIMMIGIHTQARLDWEACELIIRDGNRKIKIPTEYCKLANIGDRIMKKKGGKIDDKDADEEDVSGSEEKEETDSNNKSKDEEYKEENLLAKPRHKEKDCVLRKNLDDWTVCFTEEIKNEGKTFNLRK
ncbi:1484_t:CDS:2 [Gigaspora margarita]|uniref:1484_t:CDS:1 n=1 Tax=Gigaspora margarita TaxID=4874 RepID=A0ABN7URS7_GIGMA|nr:1484_t:CDS:2 [Gigaspora margarita]